MNHQQNIYKQNNLPNNLVKEHPFLLDCLSVTWACFRSVVPKLGLIHQWSITQWLMVHGEMAGHIVPTLMHLPAKLLIYIKKRAKKTTLFSQLNVFFSLKISVVTAKGMLLSLSLAICEVVSLLSQKWLQEIVSLMSEEASTIYP